MAGIVVLYAKPFGQNVGLRPLPTKFRTGFPTTEMKEAHRDLLHYRDTVYAHRDIPRASYTAGGDFLPGIHTSKITIGRLPSGKASLHSSPVLPDIGADSIPQIADLIRFQITRTNFAASALLTDMACGKTYLPGTYTIGVDFP